MRARTARLLAVALALAGAVPPAWPRPKAPPVKGPEAPTPEWRQGPVWYILTDEEDRAFKKVRTEEERRAFIEAFWARRDPTPSTLHNELREEFWKRVKDADRLFSEAIKPGWKTERGKLYILFGPPKDFQSWEQTPAKRHEFQWRYDAAAFPPEAVEVVQSTLNPPLTPIGAFKDTVLRPPQSPHFEDFLNRLMEERLRAGDLAKMMRLPATDDHLDEIITSSEYYNSIPMHAAYDFYRSEGDTTFSTLTLSVPGRRLALAPPGKPTEDSIILYAKLVPETSPGLSYSFTNRLEATAEDSLQKVLDDGELVFQAKGNLQPGRYRFYVGIELSPVGQVSFFRDLVTVPSLGTRELSLSSVTLLSRFERSPSGYDDRKIPFILGPFKVVPRPTRAYHNGQTLSIYYEVYDARPDPKTGKMDLDVEYQFQVSDQGRMVRIGSPFLLRHLSEAALRWSFPLSRWPVAAYRLNVKVTDRVTGEVATGETHFTIEPD